MTQFPAVIGLSSLDGSSGFRIDGSTAGILSGISIAGAGDIGGDGFDDIVIGAPRGKAGGAFIVNGSASSFTPTFSLAALDGDNGVHLVGNRTYEFGHAVGAAGDFDGDGHADVLIGAPDADPASDHDAGETLIHGLHDIARITGASPYDRSGTSVASAGDVNGDGFDDVIIGAPRADAPGARDAGAAFVVFGGATFDRDLSLLNGSDGFRLNGVDGLMGYAVASAGDFNGDGFDDVLIGGHNSSDVYVVFGKASGFSAAVDLSELDGTDGLVVSGASLGIKVGDSVAAAGDVNGDGFGDIVIGAPAGSTTGSAFVVFGSAAGGGPEIDLGALDGANGFRLDGAAKGDATGWAVSTAGDFNGDGFDDILIGAPKADAGGLEDAGSTYLVFGRASGFAPMIALSGLDGDNGLRLDGAAAGDGSGLSVSAGGDINGDGFSDLLVGAGRADPNGQSNAGSTYVIFGAPSTGPVHSEGASGDDIMTGSALDDVLKGLGGDDVLNGMAGNDRLVGAAGDDVLGGGAGADKLTGGSGADTLVGGGGADKLIGGGGSDHFVFNAVADSGQTLERDTISDLEDQDVIDLSGMDANSTLAGNQAFTLVSSFSGHPGQAVLDEIGANTLLKLDVDGDSVADSTVFIAGLHGGFTNFVL